MGSQSQKVSEQGHDLVRFIFLQFALVALTEGPGWGWLAGEMMEAWTEALRPRSGQGLAEGASGGQPLLFLAFGPHLSHPMLG